jgi:two-component system nitrate/nitrite response regulator NarL
MAMSLPIIVTHPSSLLHKGLRQLLAKSRFRPVRIATTLTQDLETYLVSLECAVWVTGIERSPASTNALVRKVVGANPCVKAVIMASSQEPEEIVAALKAGACGYLCQDIAGETLLKSLELIAHGEMIVHPHLGPIETVPANGQPADNPDDTAAHVHTNGPLTRHTRPRSPLTGATLAETYETQSGEVPSLSRREMLILRMLMQGASNKTIALKLVITESTVKVHMKAILRKLRLQNRTQAAIWARDNVDETRFSATDASMESRSVLAHHG